MAVARSLDQYQEMILALLPKGEAWPRDGELKALCRAAAEEFRRIEMRSIDLLDEADPRTVSELIADWEKDWALPGKCVVPVTLQDRRNVLVNKIVGIKDQSRQTYIDRAATLGYSITITEYASGEAIPGRPDIPVADAGYVFLINAGTTTVQRKLCGTPCGEQLSTFGNNLLECSLKEIKQAHRILLFSYS